MNAKFKILLVDDEESQREPIRGFLVKKGYDALTASSYEEFVRVISSEPIDIIITDYKMPGRGGEDVLEEAKRCCPAVSVIVMTAYGSIESAVGLMKKGAFDYIQKPIDLIDLLHIIELAKERSLLISENEMLRRQLKEKFSFDSIISQSKEMEEALNTAGRIAVSKASVMIRGESGTGKELVALAIHLASDRQSKPFVVVNCAAMPETLFESELFGHEKGAFTGAARQRIGKFEQADGGTLFIDEVGDIPLSIQVKLLRLVQFGEIERLGGSERLNPDVRIITATNRNLEEMIPRGEFREDLYYRFNVVSIQLPPLRRRRLDIIPLADHFIKKYSLQNGKEVRGISKEAAETLMRYDFPGNVRELENIIQRAIVLTRGNLISKADLPLALNAPATSEPDNEEVEIGDMTEKVERLEKAMIQKALASVSGNKVRAAEMLNISERTIRYKIGKYNLE